MRPVTKLSAFALALVASFGAGAALGAALPDLGPASSDSPTAPVGPVDPTPGGGHQP
jgi:hypothetical protein